MPESPLILWDVDGTLMRGRGAHVSRDAFLDALKQASRSALDLIYPGDAHGKTDNQIAHEILIASAIAADDALLGVFGAAYFAVLEAQREQLARDLLVLPGVREVLDALQRQGITQSLLTGNLEPIARIKLACTELDRYVAFELGAFGSDHHDRTCLVPIARSRYEQQRGAEIAPGQIVVVGDTPRDIACARAGGARVVAVATGDFSRDELEAHQPDAVLDDLSDTSAVLRTLLRYSTNAEHEQALIV